MANIGRRHVSKEQQHLMVSFLERHPDLISGRTKTYGKLLWHFLAKKLNDVEGGVQRPGRLWAKTWFDKMNSIKRVVLKQNMERQEGLPVTYVKWSPIDLRIINMLIETGEMKAEDVDVDIVEFTITTIDSIPEAPTQTGNPVIDNESLPLHASSLTLPEQNFGNVIFKNIQFVDAEECAPENMEGEDDVATGDGAPVNIEETNEINNQARGENVDPFTDDWRRMASMEEQQLGIDQLSCKARQDTSEALQRCAMAIEALAGAVNYQGSVMSDALRAQGDSIAEALKAQGKMIAEALAEITN
ncbi:hypothetical protein O0L34_g10870 [Tuta absoluta]|nr:hypothetical protein O0L34_g10870 [Tuta absoluta]